MQVSQYEFKAGDWKLTGGVPCARPHLVLAFFSPNQSGSQRALQRLRELYPDAHLAGCTTGGEILGARLLTESFVATAVEFACGRVHATQFKISDRRDSFDVGQKIGHALKAPDLRGILLLADGLDTNGTLLVRGVRDSAGDVAPIFGGLAGDGMDFIVTRVACNGKLTAGCTVGIGFYGDLDISHASSSGWFPTGEPANITNFSGSILYEIDHMPALRWLSSTSGLENRPSLPDLLAKPIWIANGPGEGGVIRSVIGIDESRGSLLLAGDVPGFGQCRTMQSTADVMIERASAAASAAAGGSGPPRQSGLALVVSCIGRRVVLGARAQQEIEATAAALNGIPQIGFHSYGEIGSLPGSNGSEFHNQTIAVTVIDEIPRAGSPASGPAASTWTTWFNKA